MKALSSHVLAATRLFALSDLCFRISGFLPFAMMSAESTRTAQKSVDYLFGLAVVGRKYMNVEKDCFTVTVTVIFSLTYFYTGGAESD